MMIVDAHSHVFPEPRGQVREGPTRGGGYGRMRVGERMMQLLPPFNPRTEFTTEMLLANLDWAGVERAVLLQGTYYGECDGYVAEAVAANPGRLVGALWCDPWGQGFRRYFEEQVEGAAFAAGKIEFSEETGLTGVHPGARLDDEEVGWLWPALEARGMVLTLDLGPPAQEAYQTEAVRAIAEAHEGLRVVLTHLAHPRLADEADPELRRRRDQQLALGELPNLWFDFASFPAILAGLEDFPYPSAARWLREGLERLGAERIMWGTDQPGMLSHLNYAQLLRLARLHTQHLPAADRALVLGETARQVYFGES